MIRLVVSDVDGTMLDETEQIPEKMKNLAELIRRKGILFTLASGREYTQVKQIVEILKLELPVILCNGTAARDETVFSWCESIRPEVLQAVIEKADDYNMTVILSMPEGEYAFRKTRFAECTMKQYGRFGNILEMPDNGWQGLCVQKVLIIDREESPHNLEKYKEVLQVLNRYCHQISWVDYGRSIDIVPKGYTKAYGVIRLSKKLGIPMSEVMTLGDDYNDLEMIEKAGMGIAVNNAVDVLKEKADYVCRAKYLDGVIEAVEKFC